MLKDLLKVKRMMIFEKILQCNILKFIDVFIKLVNLFLDDFKTIVF